MYAVEYNISFSIDPIPSKSKSKCIFMVGNNKNMVKPVPLMLGGRELPWVETATHLGHELHESGNMEHDSKVKRAEFIDKSVEARGTFKFASPVEVLHAMWCTAPASMAACYGIWQVWVFNAWNMATKLTWDQNILGTAGAILWPYHSKD